MNGYPDKLNSRAGGGGAGVAGLTTANGGTAIADNEIIRGDGTTGIQGSVLTVADTSGDITGPVTDSASSGTGLGFTNQPAVDTVTATSSSGAADAGLQVRVLGTTTNTTTVEYEDVLLDGSGAATTIKTFRLVLAVACPNVTSIGTLTFTETSGGLTITTLAAGVANKGIVSVNVDNYDRLVTAVADGASTKTVGLGGFTGAGATRLSVVILTGATQALSAATFGQVTELYTGDLEVARTATIGNFPGVKINPGVITASVVGGVIPAATTGASVVGQPVAITATSAVASTDTNGAAAGGSVTITAGAAARLVSGNANGGDINLSTGAGIGTGTAGQVLFPSGSAAKPSLAWASHPTTGFYDTGGDYIAMVTSGVLRAYLDGGTWHLQDSNTHLIFTASGDVGLIREAAGILRTSNGSSGQGWVYSDGHKALASNYTNATAGMTNLAGLTTTLKTGRKYTFRMVLFVRDSVAADGITIDFDGGAATATTFRAHATIYDSALLQSVQTSALATDIAQAVITGDSMVEVSGMFVVNAAGTFIPRAMQTAHTTGTLTVYAGSYIDVTDASYN